MTDNAPLSGWLVEPEFSPARRSDSPAALQRDQYEAARYGQQQPIIVNNYYGPQQPTRRGPDVQQVLGLVAVGGVVAGVLLAVAMTAIALGLAALALAILGVILRSL